jgi:hypothetical protein
LKRRFDQGLSIGESSLQQRPIRLKSGGEPAPRRLAQLGSQALHCFEGLPVFRDPAGLEEDQGAVLFAFQFQLLVLRGARHHTQLLGNRQPLGRIVRTVERGAPPGQGIGQRRRIVAPAGESDRFPAKRVAWPAVGLVAERGR